MWGHLWAHLVAAGLLRDLLNLALATVLGHAVLWPRWRAHRKAQRQAEADRKVIADRLDTDTPGGLGDLMPKIINTGPVPTVDAVPVTNHPSVINSTDTHPSDHPKATSGGGGTK